MLMSNDDIRRVEVITGVAGRRSWPAQEKLRIIEESLVPGGSVSAVARRNGVAPNLLFRWRRLMDEGGAMAVGSNEPGVGASDVRKLEDRVRDQRQPSCPAPTTRLAAGFSWRAGVAHP
jgi:transposase